MKFKVGDIVRVKEEYIGITDDGERPHVVSRVAPRESADWPYTLIEVGTTINKGIFAEEEITYFTKGKVIIYRRKDLGK